MQTIDIDIDATGKKITIEGKGIEGSDCKALTREIEIALGTVESTVLKAEYHRPRRVTHKVGA